MTGPGVRGIVLFRVEGPTGDDAPAESPEALRARGAAGGRTRRRPGRVVVPAVVQVPGITGLFGHVAFIFDSLTMLFYSLSIDGRQGAAGSRR